MLVESLFDKNLKYSKDGKLEEGKKPASKKRTVKESIQLKKRKRVREWNDPALIDGKAPVHNLPKDWETRWADSEYVIVHRVDDDYWFWDAWKDVHSACEAAKDCNGEIFLRSEIVDADQRQPY